MRTLTGLTLAALALGLAGCTEHKVKHTVDPIEVKPITVTVNVKIDRELDEFFDFEEQMQGKREDAEQGADQ